MPQQYHDIDGFGPNDLLELAKAARISPRQDHGIELRPTSAPAPTVVPLLAGEASSALSRLKASEKVRNSNDLDALIFVEIKEMSVAGNDDLRSCRDRAFEDAII